MSAVYRRPYLREVHVGESVTHTWNIRVPLFFERGEEKPHSISVDPDLHVV